MYSDANRGDIPPHIFFNLTFIFTGSPIETQWLIYKRDLFDL